MDLRLDEDQRLLQQTARGWLAERCPLEGLLAAEEHGHGHDPQRWQEMAGLGWLGLGVPEDAGGSGGSRRELAVLVEEMGRQLCPEPFLQAVVVAGSLLAAAGTGPAGELLRAVSAGAARPVLAAADSSGRWCPDGGGIEWDGNVLRGERGFVDGGPDADVLLVPVDGPGGIEVVAAEVADPRVTVLPQAAMVRGRLARAVFDGAPAKVVAHGPEPVGVAEQHAAAFTAAWCAGAGQRLLDDTVTYVSERIQFGVPIGSFQAVQHQLADAATVLAEGHTLARHAADALELGDPEARRLASSAFVRATEGFVFAVRRCHQVWGGMGFSTETHVHHFSRRAKLAQLGWGGVERHLDVVAEELTSAELLRDRYPLLCAEGAA